MKNFLLLLLGLVLGFALCYFFVCEKTGYADETETIVKSETTAKPKGLIDSNQAMRMSQAYNPRQKVVSALIGADDNVSTWYSLEDVRTYLTYAEREAKELGYNMNGIRLYLGVHDAATSGDQMALTTMFMVSTGTKNKSEGSMFSTSFTTVFAEGDIPGGSGLNMGNQGIPPNANYPQN